MQTTHFFAVVSQTGVAGVDAHSVLVVQPASTQVVPPSHFLPKAQPSVVVQNTHFLVAVSQTGVAGVDAQSVLVLQPESTQEEPFTQVLPAAQPSEVVQNTHLWLTGSQTGVAPVHWLLAVQPVHWPPLTVTSQEVPVPQPSVAVQTTHLRAVLSQTGVVGVEAQSALLLQPLGTQAPPETVVSHVSEAEHPASSVQTTHRFAARSQTGAEAVQLTFFVHSTQTGLAALVSQTLPEVQPFAAVQATHFFADSSQMGVLPVQVVGQVATHTLLVHCSPAAQSELLTQVLSPLGQPVPTASNAIAPARYRFRFMQVLVRWKAASAQAA